MVVVGVRKARVGADGGSALGCACGRARIIGQGTTCDGQLQKAVRLGGAPPANAKRAVGELLSWDSFHRSKKRRSTIRSHLTHTNSAVFHALRMLFLVSFVWRHAHLTSTRG